MSILDTKIRGETIRDYLWPSKSQYRASDRMILVSALVVAAIAVSLVVSAVSGAFASKPTATPSPAPATSARRPTPSSIPMAPVPAQASTVLMDGAIAQVTRYWVGVPIAPGYSTPRSVAEAPSHQPTAQVLSVLSSTQASVAARVSVTILGKTTTISSTVVYVNHKWYYVPG